MIPSDVSQANLLPATPDRRRGHVLLVEDHAANRKLALAMLDKLGYAADAVGNGLEAVEAVGRVRYDAVLMDCRMPVMDGFRATEMIRSRERTSPGVPIIAMTADAMEEDRQKCLKAGMDDYLPKPVSLETLAGVLGRWVPSSGQSPGTPLPAAASSPDRRAQQEQESVLDPAVIAGLRGLDNRKGPRSVADLVSVMLVETESNVERLRRAVEKRDLDTIADRSHALAGSVATFGASGMARLCRLMRTLVADGRTEAAGETLAAIEAEFQRVKVALRAAFPANSDGSREQGE